MKYNHNYNIHVKQNTAQAVIWCQDIKNGILRFKFSPTSSLVQLVLAVQATLRMSLLYVFVLAVQVTLCMSTAQETCFRSTSNALYVFFVLTLGMC